MTVNDRFERDLAAWLDAETTLTAPAGLHATAIAAARPRRQRPAWLVALRGGTIGGPTLVVDRRAAAAMAVIALLVLGMVAAVLAGRLQERPRPLGGNGVIAYTFQGPGHGASRTHIVKADGTGDRSTPTPSCAWSPDGRHLVRSGSDGPTALLLLEDPAAGTHQAIPVPYLVSPSRTGFAQSPDGTRIAWLKGIVPTVEGPHRVELWVTRLDDGTSTLVVPAPAGVGESLSIPAWSPDGRALVFETHRTDAVAGRERSAISVVDLETKAVRLISTRPSLLPAGDLVWSGDGGSILFTGVPDGTPLPIDGSTMAVPSDVFVVGKDGRGERNLTRSAASERQLAMAPDGERLGYLTISDGDETTRVATLPMDGARSTGEPVVGPESELFVWSPDARRLLWAGPGPDGEGSTLRSIDRDLAGPSTAIATVAGSFTCAAWQRAEP